MLGRAWKYVKLSRIEFIDRIKVAAYGGERECIYFGNPPEPFIPPRVPKYHTGYPLQEVQITLIEPPQAYHCSQKYFKSHTNLQLGCDCDANPSESRP